MAFILIENGQIVQRARNTEIDRPPLSGPGGMLVECWPLRQRERGRRSRLT
jgi:hypothetical protein